jgi:hypothetical protein
MTPHAEHLVGRIARPAGNFEKADTLMTYESTQLVTSAVDPAVTYTVAKMSFARRADLMRRIRELARKAEFHEAAPAAAGSIEVGGNIEAGWNIEAAGEKMDAAILQSEIDRIYLLWGLREIAGLQIDGLPATPELLASAGPEDLCREAAEAVRTAAGLTHEERKN